MKKIVLIIVLTVVLLTAFFFTQEADKRIEGSWLGTLNAMGTELRLVFNISRSEDGTLAATMDSLDQGSMGNPMDGVRFEDGKWILELKRAGVTYTAELSEDGQTLKGIFKQGGFTAPFDARRSEPIKKEELIRPQDPKKPYPYHEEDVTYTNDKDGITLAGTLTFPMEGGPFPAVVLITGSGAQNRDEELMGHRPFLVLADYLTRRGIAVLRVDDRGVGGSTGKISESTSVDFAGDVLAGVAFLKTRKEIDPKKIGLIGHSEGGIIAPIAAAKSKDVTFIVLMAGTGLNGEEILYLQGALLNRAGGYSEEIIQANLDQQKKIFSIMKKHEKAEDIRTELQNSFNDDIKKMSVEDREALGDNPQQKFDSEMEQILTPWFRFFLTYDPLPALRKVTCPVLAINGEKDLQVPPKENLAAIEGALKEAGNTDYTLKELPGLNHIFQKAETGSVSEYIKIEETINPEALKTIGDWILARVK
ncbi:MAG: alpha/beta fold hydrolase [Acidobacteria bacterium]|nr:alpha/beta fold hydrolase [Acidobacteriota bacterium]MBU4496270.1 alpha/beta fold hydrolase [Acidobacteriota bacterium]